MTVPAVLDRSARLWPRRTAVAILDGGLTYRDLGAAANGLTARVVELGLRPGDRVAILADNAPAYLAAYFAIPAAGAVLLPLNTRLAAEELHRQLADTDCRLLLHGAGFESAAHDAVAGLDVAVRPLTLDGTAGGPPQHRADPDDLAYLYFTSGSTGRPKAVMLSHRQVLSGALSSTAALALGGDDVWLHAGPLFHLADAWTVWGLTWVGGTHVVQRFAPEAALRAIEDHRVTRTLLVPTALDMLVDVVRVRGTSLAGLRTLGFGGAPMPAAVYERARDVLRCPLVPTYGATELSGLCTALDADDGAGAAWSSIGRETAVHTITLTDADGHPVPDGEPGELQVTGPAVMTGYWRRPDATAEVLTVRRGGNSDVRTLRTGDLAVRDPEGRLHLKGRLKDMIITGGENVAALEVEQVLGTHPAVAEVAVIGRADPRWGESVCAVVVGRPGSAPTLDELRDFARLHLAGYKLPRTLHVVDALPRTGSGKIDKTRLRRRMDGESHVR